MENPSIRNPPTADVMMLWLGEQSPQHPGSERNGGLSLRADSFSLHFSGFIHFWLYVHVDL